MATGVDSPEKRKAARIFAILSSGGAAKLWDVSSNITVSDDDSRQSDTPKCLIEPDKSAGFH